MSAMTVRSGTWVAAVDLGASSVRVCACNLDARPVAYEVVHRVAHSPLMGSDGVLRWNWPTIRAAVHDGLERARLDYPLRSIGIDTWAVDYGLIDRSGRLLADPVCYRDTRTANHNELVERIGPERLFSINGLQTLAFNTIFQLHVEDRHLLDRAHHVLTLPELLVHDLTGVATSETTSAGSTGLVDQRTRDWSAELLDCIGVNSTLFPDILSPGTRVGEWRGIPVHLVAGHDTASAVVGIAASEPGSCFVSSGTWVLAGQELPAPVLTGEARIGRFSNEYGPEGTTRFLRNIAGFWIVEECRRAWGGPSTADLLASALVAAPTAPEVIFDATDPRFLAPADMVTEVLDAAGLQSGVEPATTVAVIVNSLAASTADVLSAMAAITGSPIRLVNLIGGGLQSDQFKQQLAHRACVDVVAGSVESTVVGNALMQGIGLGCWAGVAEARAALKP